MVHPGPADEQRTSQHGGATPTRPYVVLVVCAGGCRRPQDCVGALLRPCGRVLPPAHTPLRLQTSIERRTTTTGVSAASWSAQGCPAPRPWPCEHAGCPPAPASPPCAPPSTPCAPGGTPCAPWATPRARTPTRRAPGPRRRAHATRPSEQSRRTQEQGATCPLFRGGGVYRRRMPVCTWRTKVSA